MQGSEEEFEQYKDNLIKSGKAKPSEPDRSIDQNEHSQP